tara:strand:+ start:3061 stop:3978 length:918 start_codon:yes stop_codon:yes gene_type:complete
MDGAIIKTLYNSSFWCKFVLILSVFILYYLLTTKSTTVEGFVQRDKFVIKEGTAIYDSFYASIYDDLVQDKVKNEYEVGTIINLTKPNNQSLILDIGSGTGHHVAAFNSKNINAIGLDKSQSMVAVANKKYPKLEFNVGDTNDVMLYPAHTFTHITCLYFTIYYIKDKFSFFRNCYEWLKPGGYLVIHTVNKDKFDPILNAANPFSSLSVQNYAKERVTTSFIKFHDFKYRANFILDENTENAKFEETFTDDNGKVRKNIHKMFMPTQEEIARIGKEAGFIINAKVDLDTVQYDNQQILLLYKPE